MTEPRLKPPSINLAAELEALLLAYESVQERLLSVAAEQRQALAQADAQLWPGARSGARRPRTNSGASTWRATPRRPAGRSPTRLTDLTTRLAEPDRSRLHSSASGCARSPSASPPSNGCCVRDRHRQRPRRSPGPSRSPATVGTTGTYTRLARRHRSHPRPRP